MTARGSTSLSGSSSSGTAPKRSYHWTAFRSFASIASATPCGFDHGGGRLGRIFQQRQHALAVAPGEHDALLKRYRRRRHGLLRSQSQSTDDIREKHPQTRPVCVRVVELNISVNGMSEGRRVQPRLTGRCLRPFPRIGDGRLRSLEAAVPPRWARVPAGARSCVRVYPWRPRSSATRRADVNSCSAVLPGRIL